MTYGNGTVADLRGALGRVREQVTELQTVAWVAQDKADGAAQMIRTIGEQSGRTEMAGASAGLDSVRGAIESAIAVAALVTEQLDTYVNTL